MDRSFLSQADVIDASRRFVCVRLTTYENKEEGEFLKAFLVTRSGELENTVFTILSPDGKRQLARAARSAKQTFGDAQRMAETMTRIGGEFSAKKTAEGQPPALPRMRDVRLAVNVAACDNRPLVVLFAPDDKSRRTLEERLTPLAAHKTFLGQFVYVSASGAKELSEIEGAKAEAGVMVVQPDSFGLKGKVLIQAGIKVSDGELAKCLQEGISLYQGEEKSFRGHVQEGHKKGVFWETVIPVTDPMEQRARERGRNSRSSPD